MNFEGFTPHPIERFSSLVEQDDATALPLGVAAVARNVEFHLTSVRTRPGLQSAYGFTMPAGVPVTGLASLKLQALPEVQVPMAFDASGNLVIESPAGTGNLISVTSSLVTPPANSSAQIAAAFNRGYIAFGNLVESTASPAVYDLASGRLDPLSMKPTGVNWLPNTQYNAGELVTPTTLGNGHTYVCVVSGISGSSPPLWATADANVFTDGSVTWKEQTMNGGNVLPGTEAPAAQINRGAGSFAGGLDIYVVYTLLNGVGEGYASDVFSYLNSQANDQLVMQPAPVPSWLGGLQAPYAPVSYNVYEADVAHGAAAPALSSYKLAGNAASGTNFVMNNSGTGAAPPATNTASIVPAGGSVIPGLRYAAVLYLNRNGYITGMTNGGVVPIAYAPNTGYLFVGNIPVGPPNTVARIVAFTAIPSITAGPFFYIAGPDNANGIAITATQINDNVSTSATFNFTDEYLTADTDVTAYFRKVQVPGCADIFYANSIQRLVYKADNLPSGFYVSLPNDPESIYGDTSIVQVAETNGQNAVCWREFKGVQYALKEGGGHVVTPNANDPSQWDVTEQWRGSGPCGPRAVAVTSEFMVYVHRSGCYVFMGNVPERISKELPITWSQINWQQQQSIWVHIDEVRKEIRIGVPYRQSTVPSLVIKCNYEECGAAFNPPLHPGMMSAGKLLSTAVARKWSLDDIAANVCIRAARPLASPTQGMDYQTRQSQILLGSSGDGTVNAMIPGIFNDNGGGIDSRYETASEDDLMAVCQLGGVSANVSGAGQGLFSVLAGRGSREIPLKTFDLTANPDKGYSAGGRGQNERFRLKIWNGQVPDAWWDLKWANIYARRLFSARTK